MTYDKSCMERKKACLSRHFILTNGRTVRANVIFIRSLERNIPVIFASHRAV